DLAFLDQKDPDWESTQTVAPGNVSVAALSGGSLQLTWDPILFSAYGGWYNVLYSTTPGGPYAQYETTDDKTVPSMTVTGLNPATRYYFVVRTRSTTNYYNDNLLDSECCGEVYTDTFSSITVTSPNGGENLDAGSNYDIAWTSEGEVGNVEIAYSTNNGSTWKIIESSWQNDGFYNWTVPSVSSDDCLVRVMEKDNDGGPSDVSDQVFSIVFINPGSITLRSPNGGESWEAGSTQPIKWNSTGDINYVSILFSVDNGKTWKTINQNTTNDGIYNWLVPQKISDQCLVQVTANDSDLDPEPSDASNAVFSIVLPPEPVLRVTAPNGGEQLLVGSRFNIKWYAVNTRMKAIIEYSVNGGQSWQEITGAAKNDGEYAWWVPDEPSDDCLVRVTEAGSRLSDVSDNVFAIVTPLSDNVTVISPNGGENWEAGSEQEITWTTTGIDNSVAIGYSTDNGVTWKVITQATGNDGSFAWTVPDTVSDECRVRVIANNSGDPKPSDVSDGVFSITFPSDDVVRIIAPNGGEQLVVGARFDITWYGSNSRAEVLIEYSVDDGQTWTDIAGAAPNDGNYNWTVPDTPSETCWISISENGSQAVDISDAAFSIVPPLSEDIIVTSPNGGETLAADSMHEITWTQNGEFTNVTIALSTDNGITWQEIVQTTLNDGSFDWTVPDTPSDECLVRVAAADSDVDPKPSDVSDQVFSIVQSSEGVLKVTSPNGGETWEVDSNQTITWTGSGTVNQVMIQYSVDNGNTWATVETSIGNDGSCDWRVPDTVSDHCLVRVSANDGDGDPLPSDDSDSEFFIVLPSSPTIRVITPNGGEQAVIGTTFKISWFGTDSRALIRIEYSVNGGQNWTEIIGDTENDGQYDWLVPDEPSDTCLVRVSDAGGQPLDISDTVFSIVQPLSGNLTVLTPNGGETLEAGLQYDITWTSGGLNSVAFEYSLNNGDTWTYIAVVSADNGIYSWTVPDTASDNCLIRISGSESDENPVDVSDGVFSIISPSAPAVTVTSPNGGETLTAGTEFQITWTSTGLNNVLLEYSTDNRSSWHVIETVSADNNGYNWIVPNEPSDTCFIRITGTDPNIKNPLDTSDAVFSITAQ
ncbi:MAG: hypothetical protein GY950_08535, partial [bacterium]|nr:hypothetical protein [bacterium]